MVCVNSVSVYPKSVTIKLNSWYYDAYAEICPCEADCCEVTWHSEDPSIASVNADSGYIYANALGTTRIYATATDGSVCSDYIDVTVSHTVPVTTVILNRRWLSLERGHSYSLVATVFPNHATNKTLNWVSSNNDIVTVNDGVVTAVSLGSATITATAADGSGKSAICTITVTSEVLVSSITVEPSSTTMILGESTLLTAIVSPEDASNKTVIWSSDNTNVITVNEDSGLVTAQSDGEAIVYATSCDGNCITGSCSITVNRPILINRIDVSPDTLSLNVGETATLSAEAFPENAKNKTIRWVSDDESIAEVGLLTGCVTAKKSGSTNIYAKAQDGSGVRGCCEVTCNPPDTDSIPEHSDTSSHIYHASLSENRDEYTFACTVSQCDDSFTVPKDQVVGSYVTSNTDPHLGDSQTPLAYGIDVSKHQGDISQSKWNEIANTQIDGNTITFAILRIGREVSNNADGSINRQKDEYFERNYERAKAAGLYVGCYYYTESWSPQNAVADAEQVIEWIGDKQFEYPVFFDIESTGIANNVPNKDDRTEICTAFMNKMREAGFFSGLYANNNWITNYLNSSTLFPEYDFWYARYYDNTPNNWQSHWAGSGRKFGMWQYTESKTIAPISGNVDCNVAYKNYPLIIKSLHLNNF